jgi:adenosylcobyric acid synthase
MSARDYFAYKKQLIPDIKYAYEKLASENDIVVIEGAGSPVEINLKADDIVNMGMAKIAKSPVLIVGDIDRGGVFAQLCGTMMLLENDEKDMVKGLIINKFRGDKTILEPGIEALEKLAGKKVVGTVPYMELSLEDEDSLTDRFNAGSNSNLHADIDIAVIKLPHISNFTDFNIWENVEGVALRYVVRPYELGNPDLIILPGTKNTIEDLRWLRESGMETNILRKYNNKECVIFGICGGYQMLGESIIDINGMESAGTKIRGIGLIPMVTEFENNKERTQITGVIENVDGIFGNLNGLEISGYEIHMGNSTVTKPFLRIKDEVTGACKADGYSSERVYGTYVHGIFDRHEIVEGMVKSLAKLKGIDVPKTHILDYSQYKQLEYDKLADGLRQSLDMDKIYKIIEEGVL